MVEKEKDQEEVIETETETEKEIILGGEVATEEEDNLIILPN